eukprot:gene8234-2297_t
MAARYGFIATAHNGRATRSATTQQGQPRSMLDDVMCFPS